MRGILIVAMILLPFIGFSQSILKGKVIDELTNEGLIGVSISAGDNNGTSSELDGEYLLSLEKGTHVITFSYLGYAEVKETVIADGINEIILDIRLEEESELLQITTVTGSRYERDFTTEPVSMAVIRPEFIERNANTDLAQVIERVPGVQVVDGQANIRSGGGFAYGAGSRVAVVVDEQPLLSAELSDVKWNFIPIENASQIEIIKGAASVLYGSGGLNGVINVRTAYPTSEPYTKLTYYTGLYHISGKEKVSPTDPDSIIRYNRQWYRESRDSVGARPFFSGIYFAHREKLSDNFELVLGANLHYDRSFLKDADEQRYRFNFNTKYRLPKNEKISIGLNGNLMYHNKADFFIWDNAYEKAYEHLGDPSSFNYYTITIDPYLTAFDGVGNKHSLKLRYFTIAKYVSTGKSPTALYSGEYQFQKKFEDIGLALTTGISYQHVFAKSNLFSSEVIESPTDTVTIYDTQRINVSSFYLQADKTFFNEKLNLTLGTRIENFKFPNENARTIPVLRGGANYAVTKRDFVRASYGQGYRIPSLAEKYIDDEITEGLNVYPNPDLKTEKGYSVEIGYKRAFGKKKWKGFIDFTTFWMDYDDLTEFEFGIHRPDSITGDTTLLDYIRYIGFKTKNVSRARIAGFELSAFGEGKIGNIPTRFWGGYTYSYPGDLSEDPSQDKIGIYIKNVFKGLALSPSDPEAGNLLNFRALHTARFDAEVDVKDFTFGAALNYNGFMYDVDNLFKGEGEVVETLILINNELVVGIVEGLSDFRQKNIRGDWVLDIRASYKFKEKNKVDLMLNNALNREYAVRPLKMSPPLTFNFRYNRVF